jgi:hypothetical protein
MATIADPGLEIRRFPLPVCGRTVGLRPVSGVEDLLLREADRSPAGEAALALALAKRLATALDGQSLDWEHAAVTDLDTLILRLRQVAIGSRIRSGIQCPSPECACRIDIRFRIESYIQHHAPRPRPRVRGWTAEPDTEAGWFMLIPPRANEDPALRFRLPTAGDQLLVAGREDAAETLARLCLRPADAPARLVRHAETLMEAMAPSLTDEIQGVCPDCSRRFTIEFDARWFCLSELCNRASYIYQDIDLLARRYHWTERDILALSHSRRAAYAELALQKGGD